MFAFRDVFAAFCAAVRAEYSAASGVLFGLGFILTGSTRFASVAGLLQRVTIAIG